MFQCILGVHFPHQGKATADREKGRRGVWVSQWNQTLKYLNNGGNGLPFKSSKWISAKSETEKGSQRETERDLWSVSTLTGVTFLFLLVWQKPIVKGFSRWLMDTVPIKSRRLDIYISQNIWKTFSIPGCWPALFPTKQNKTGILHCLLTCCFLLLKAHNS